MKNSRLSWSSKLVKMFFDERQFRISNMSIKNSRCAARGSKIENINVEIPRDKLTVLLACRVGHIVLALNDLREGQRGTRITVGVCAVNF